MTMVLVGSAESVQAAQAFDRQPVEDADRRVDRRAGWQVDRLTRTDGVADVRRHDGCLHVTVGDVASAGGRATGASPDATEAWLHPGGRLVVRTHVAPPALLVTPSGARLLPTAPDVQAEVTAVDGDILIMCSAEALDHLPKGLGGILSCSPLRVGAHDPGALLAQLMDGSEFGAAVVARCLSATPNLRTEDHR